VYSIVRPNAGFLYPHVFNTTDSERDTDAIPFCDWMFDTSPADTMYRFGNLTTSSCDAIDWVRCEDGNVIELQLGYHAFSGQLKSEWFETMYALKEINFGYNQLTGPMPSSVYTSENLEVLFMPHNHLSGTLECPPHAEPRLQELDLDTNDFTGPIPTCLFTALTHLKELDLSYLRLSDAVIPPEIQYAQHLTRFRAVSSGLKGMLPDSLKCMRRLLYLGVGNNAIYGPITQNVIDGMERLVTLAVDHNMLSGDVPHFTNPSLDNLYLDHNMFSGSFDTQLLEFSNNQGTSSSAVVHIGYNSLSGPLPSVFYKLLTNAHAIYSLEAEGNFFHCDGLTKDWPEWVWRTGSFSNANSELSRYRHTLGVCTKVPTVSAVSAIERNGDMTITGTDFANTDQLKCKLCSVSDPSLCYATDAAYMNPTTLSCLTKVGAYAVSVGSASSSSPPLTGGEEYTVTVANYGTDYFSATTHPESYDMLLAAGSLTATVVMPSPPPPDADIVTQTNLTEDDLTGGAVAGIVVGCLVVALLLGAFICFMRNREKAGKPLFRKAGSAARPVVSAAGQVS